MLSPHSPDAETGVLSAPPVLAAHLGAGKEFQGGELALRKTHEAESELLSVFLTCIAGLDPRSCGAALGTYGSLARREFAGGSSDIDVFIIERGDAHIVRRKFEQLHHSPGLLDLPEWNSPEKVIQCSKAGLIERNQVIDLRFVAGDSTIIEQIREHQLTLSTPDAHFENLTFHRLYFDHYFPTRQGAFLADLKYSQGGIRSWMFLHFHGQLKQSLNYPFQTTDCESAPRVLQCIRSLAEEEQWTSQFTASLERAVSRLLEIKSEAVIDSPTLALEAREALRRINYAVDQAWYNSLELMRPRYGQEVIDAITMVHRGRPLTEKLWQALGERSTCPISRLALIWSTNLEASKERFNDRVSRMPGLASWSTLASLAANKHADSELLDSLAQISIDTPGYGFIARIVAKHPKVSERTLSRIATDSRLPWGHREIAYKRLYIPSANENPGFSFVNRYIPEGKTHTPPPRKQGNPEGIS